MPSPPVPITAHDLLERRYEVVQKRKPGRRHVPLPAIAVCDTSMLSKPLRSLRPDARLPIAFVESVCKQPRLVETIDLLRCDLLNVFQNRLGHQ